MEKLAASVWTALLSIVLLMGGHVIKVNGAICTSSVCMYELNMTLSRTMSYQDEDLVWRPVTLNGSRLQVAIGSEIRVLSPDDVVVADGFPGRPIILINGKFIGPTIEVMEGSQLVIQVNNFLSQRAITIHWHGLVQKGTYYMDGTESIVQCGIPPGNSFTYRFSATPAGTHWYHSHLASMHLDGLFGMLIVHAALPTIPYFVAFVQDYSHVSSETFELGIVDLCSNGAVGAPYKRPGVPVHDCSIEGAEMEPEIYVSSLFGGRNRWMNQSFPLMEYVVKSGNRYRFRLANSGDAFPFQIRIDGHPLTIVASDGNEIVPVVVDSLYIFIAETIDFEITANQTPGRYWIHADTPCPGFFARGILSYEGFENRTDDPRTQTKNCTLSAPCRTFNCPVSHYPQSFNQTCISMSELTAVSSHEILAEEYGVGDTEVLEYFFNVAMVAGASINGRRFMMPSLPLTQDPGAAMDCVGEPCLDGCSCSCAQTLTLPYGKTIQFVISNFQPDPNVAQHAYHTIHLHGHNFAVMAEEFPSYDPISGRITSPNGNITCGSDILCAHPRWSGSPPDYSIIRNPMIKDSILLPVRGYIVIRFVANNPGIWLFHCHIDVHMLGGMTVLIREAPERLPEIPYGFPTCNRFVNKCDMQIVNSMTEVSFN